VKRTIEVAIPAGIDDGQRLRMPGRGHAGGRGAPAGDLYVSVRVAPDPRFHRDGADLDTEVDVTMFEAALGTTASITTLEGEEPLQLAAGTQPGEVVTLKARGIPYLNGGGRGDLRVHVRVAVPRGLDEAQRRELKRAAEAVRERNYRPHESGLFDRLKGAFR
jgi:molecular chaperone DnaJ